MGRHIYVHNPFCVRKCPYCDFFSVTDRSLAKDYYEAAMAEARFWAGFEKNITPCDDGPDTVYFGGGTPSCVPESLVCKLLETVTESFGIGSDAEITLEVNPASFTLEKGRAYLGSGFNRISMGIQSLDDNVLKTLGRLHDSKGALKALDSAFRSGFTNISADFITGVPGETLDGILKDLQKVLDKGVKHISTYSLMIEEGTLFHERYKDNIEDLVPPETERAMYHAVRGFLKDKGLIPYEISNSAVPGFESRHNTAYWDGRDYFAVGAGAHGFLNSVRFGHYDNVESYISNACTIKEKDVSRLLGFDEDDTDSIEGLLYCEERLDLEDRMREYPFLKLRTSKGIDTVEFERRFGKSFEEVYKSELESNIGKGYLKAEGQRISLTEKGLDFANPVMEDFL
ncbi:MAG: radical SAM family heme chaperone HemW [Clostridiales bacterium]|nr:radical SAM family heme chaperone HemW [Clostridiales bacterium]